MLTERKNKLAVVICVDFATLRLTPYIERDSLGSALDDGTFVDTISVTNGSVG